MSPRNSRDVPIAYLYSYAQRFALADIQHLQTEGRKTQLQWYVRSARPARTDWFVRRNDELHEIPYVMIVDGQYSVVHTITEGSTLQTRLKQLMNERKQAGQKAAVDAPPLPVLADWLAALVEEDDEPHCE